MRTLGEVVWDAGKRDRRLGRLPRKKEGCRGRTTNSCRFPKRRSNVSYETFSLAGTHGTAARALRDFDLLMIEAAGMIRLRWKWNPCPWSLNGRGPCSKRSRRGGVVEVFGGACEMEGCFGNAKKGLQGSNATIVGR